ncbi:MAG: WD40 repeat domain-containing protein [Opitutaceae bacterium]|jgi:WD40 repeat protein
MQLTKHWAAQLDDYVIDLGWSADGTRLAAAASSGPVSLFASTDGTRTDLPGHDDGANCLAWHPSQLLLTTGGQDAKVKLWDATTAQHTASAEVGGAWIEHLAWSPDGTKLAAAAGRHLAFLNADGSTRHAFKPAPKTISAIAWQPAGGCLASAYFGGVCLWDADDFIAQKEFAYANGIHALVWSPDNRWLVSGNQDPSVHLWLPDTTDEFHMSGYEGKVKELSFDRDSHWLATGGGQDSCLWDCTGAGPEGREPIMLPHDARVCAVAFQHDHGLLATASQDGVIRIWSPERPKPLRATVKMPVPATKLSWSPDDQLLAVGSEKGVVYVLKCEA